MTTCIQAGLSECSAGTKLESRTADQKSYPMNNQMDIHLGYSNREMNIHLERSNREMNIHLGYSKNIQLGQPKILIHYLFIGYSLRINSDLFLSILNSRILRDTKGY